jgi:phospholipase/carboxylesterase
MTEAKLTRPHVWLPSAQSANTLLLLHGSGADEFDLLSLGKALDPSANILSPRGLASQDGMVRFFEYFEDFSAKEDTLLEAVQSLAEFLKLASKHYGFDPARVTAVGFSNGAHMAGALLTVHPELLRGILAFGTTRAFVETEFKPNLQGKFVFIANGEKDPYSPKQKSEDMIQEFGAWGARVEVLMHSGGHQISPEHVEILARELALS